ncbi:MAG: hypothetical protein VX436_02750 [Planctomycetota bacterium]|nr:hypothetical protein [Planctomycetota bacterium]
MHFVSFLTVCVVSMATVFVSVNPDHSDAAIRQLKDATRYQRSGQHLLNLSALRNLRDEDLRPFFLQIVEHPEWTVQVHAVLGLAELSEEEVIDPWLVQQVAPSAREHLIPQALDDGLFKKEQIKELLSWPLLEAAPKLLLLADIHSIEEGGANEDMLEELANLTDLSVAMFASILTENKTIIRDATVRLRRAARADRDRALHRTMQLIRQYKVDAASDWLVSILRDHAVGLSDEERYWTLYTLLSIDINTGIKIWNRSFSLKPTRAEQVRYLLILLESGVVPTPEVLKRLKIDPDDPLLGLMARAGNVNKEGDMITAEDIQHIINLVERGHRASVDWAFRIAQNRLSKENAQTFYASLSKIPDKATPRRKDVSIRAFTHLIEIDSNAAWEILRNTKDDSAQQELLLFAMLQATEKETIQGAIQEASKLRRIGVNNSDVMTLLLIARGSVPLKETDQKYLGIVAAGGGHVSPALETQAAWLYLKQIGLADKALAAVSTE